MTRKQECFTVKWNWEEWQKFIMLSDWGGQLQTKMNTMFCRFFLAPYFFVAFLSPFCSFFRMLKNEFKNPPHDNCQKSRFWNQDPGHPLKKFQKFFFSRDSWDLFLWSVLVAKLTPLTHYRQNDNFVTLGGKIWNQDPDQIWIFFQKFFLPK